MNHRFSLPVAIFCVDYFFCEPMCGNLGNGKVVRRQRCVSNKGQRPKLFRLFGGSWEHDVISVSPVLSVENRAAFVFYLHSRRTGCFCFPSVCVCLRPNEPTSERACVCVSIIHRMHAAFGLS